MFGILTRSSISGVYTRPWRTEDLHLEDSARKRRAQSLGSERAVSESRRWKGQARSAKLAKAWIIRSSNL
jgi:hypothetical protein